MTDIQKTMVDEHAYIPKQVDQDPIVASNEKQSAEIVKNLATRLESKIRNVFQEKRLGVVVALTKEQIEHILYHALEQGLTLEDVRQITNEETKHTNAQIPERVVDMSARETSKFTTRAFGMRQRAFITKMVDRITHVFDTLKTGNEEESTVSIPYKKEEIRHFVIKNIRENLRIMDKALNFNKFLEGERTITDAQGNSRLRTPEDIYRGIELLEQDEVKTLEETYEEVLQKWKEVQYLEQEGLQIHKVLTEIKENILMRLRQFPTPYYLFQAVHILTREAHRSFLQAYEEFPVLRWPEDAQDETMAIRKVDIPQEIREALLGYRILEKPYRVRYIKTLPDFETALEDYEIQHGIESSLESLDDIRSLFDKHMNLAYADLLLALGVMTTEEYSNGVRRGHVLATFDNAVQQAVEALQNEKKNIERECFAMGIHIPKNELNIDIHNRAKVTTLLELLSVVSDDSYPVADRFGAQIAATDAFYFGVLERSSLYKEAEEIRQKLPKGEVGTLSQHKVLKRSMMKSADGYTWEYYDLDTKDGDDISAHIIENEAYQVVLQEDLQVRFWHPEGKSEEEDPEGGVYFTSPSTPQTKSVASNIMKLIVPNDVNQVVDIFDMNRNAFNFCYTTEEIIESIAEKERHPDQQGLLIDRLYAFMEYIAKRRMNWKTKNTTVDTRRNLNSGEFVVENKLTNTSNKKSSSLFGALKVYGRTKRVGMEVQFRTLDTIMGESTETGSHGFYETNRWNEVSLEKYAKSIYPGAHESLQELIKRRSSYRKEVEKRIREHHHAVLKAKKEK